MINSELSRKSSFNFSNVVCRIHHFPISRIKWLGSEPRWFNHPQQTPSSKISLANSWGSDENGSGLGFGPQEEFYGCADISVYSRSSNGPPTTTHKTITTRPGTTRPGTLVTKPTTAPTIPPSVGDGNFCSDKANGLYQHPKCTKFYQEGFQSSQSEVFRSSKVIRGH